MPLTGSGGIATPRSWFCGTFPSTTGTSVNSSVGRGSRLTPILIQIKLENPQKISSLDWQKFPTLGAPGPLWAIHPHARRLSPPRASPHRSGRGGRTSQSRIESTNAIKSPNKCIPQRSKGWLRWPDPEESKLPGQGDRTKGRWTFFPNKKIEISVLC